MFKFLVLFLLVSCATGYQPSGFSGGFSEQKLANDMYQVRFSGNGYTGEDTVQRYLLRRCAEITLMNGYTHFYMVGSKDSTQTSFYSGQSYGQSSLHSVNRHSGLATIKLLNNPPKDAIVYDAKIIFGSDTAERSVANENTKSCQTSKECQNGETCKMHYTHDGQYGVCGNYGIWGKIFNP